MGRKDIKPTTLMGASTWNSKQTIDHCERDCDHALFVDAFYPDSPDPKVRDFVAGFRDETGAEPSLWEAQAFDTAGLVKWILASDRPRDRKQMRDSMLGMAGFAGTTGKLRFDRDGEVRRKLHTLTIERVEDERAIRTWERDGPEG
jgi:ABC-type branched-subunit amino acid transport system substrate-binding protein